MRGIKSGFFFWVSTNFSCPIIGDSQGDGAAFFITNDSIFWRNQSSSFSLRAITEEYEGAGCAAPSFGRETPIFNVSYIKELDSLAPVGNSQS